MRPTKLVRIVVRWNSKVESMSCNAKMVGHIGDSKTQADKKKNLFLCHGDELVIQSNEFSCLLCNIFGYVAVSRIFPFESIHCLLLQCLCWYCLGERAVFFECLLLYVLYQICSIKCSSSVAPSQNGLGLTDRIKCWYKLCTSLAFSPKFIQAQLLRLSIYTN